MQAASVSVSLDTRRPLTSGMFPVKLCFTLRMRESGGKTRWVRKYYRLAEAFPADFAAIRRKGKKSREQDKLAEVVREAVAHAQGIIQQNKVISVNLFDRLFTGVSGHTVGSMFERYIVELREYGQVGTAGSYNTAWGSIKAFAKGDLVFQEITLDWLRRYERWMKSHKVMKVVNGQVVEVEVSSSITTIGIYLRCLRKIYNNAIAAKLISADLYPFGRRQFVIQSVVKPKQALSPEQKDAVLAYAGKEQEAVDFWVFSYLCNGMNFSDIARLRRHDIQEDWILLDRAKTRRTLRVLRKIEIPLTDQSKAILARRGSRNLSPDAFVFDVLQPGLTPQQEKNRILDFIDRTNKGLREVAKELGFSFRFTTYTARHTFANISMNSGASKAQIQEALGHASIRTTEIYTGAFDRDTKKKMSAKL